MKITCVFVSNYLNHHQIPFCDAMYRKLDKSFAFIQTEPMEDERVKMGWNADVSQPYLHLYYKQTEECREMIRDAKLVFFGGCDDESYIVERLQAGKPIIRISERLYKTGQWKAISPRGLIKKYHDHTKYRSAPVYLLCAGGYVASDFHIVRAYPKKMFRWGYFPQTKQYDLDELMKNKSFVTEKVPTVLWAARMIDWKHPELALEVARHLKAKGYAFRMNIIGGGELFQSIQSTCESLDLNENVTFLGFLPPEEVRKHMEKADIFLFTSDRQEGWGAVANEAMNSGCAVVADHMIGAVPYLIQDGVNGVIYKDGEKEELFSLMEKLIGNPSLCEELGRSAYHTIADVWNAENAAENLLHLTCSLNLLDKSEYKIGEEKITNTEGPCSPAPVVKERKMYRLLKTR